MISNSLATQKKKRLIIWAVRQLITACIVIPVVIAWPNWKWLIWAWIGLASFSLVAMLLMFRRLERRIGDVVSELSSAPDNDRNA
ncbi:MAG: hypothetical protein EOP84_33990 [Verrucomicrobiaceae bacterium]|nr:MAG: hypothetical protein EOP84_33990 [Verrucomicrobiaceae bacterium]